MKQFKNEAAYKEWETTLRKKHQEENNLNDSEELMWYMFESGDYFNKALVAEGYDLKNLFEEDIIKVGEKTEITTQTVIINGIKFNLGWLYAFESSGPIFEIYREDEKHGALSVRKEGDELGWNSGLFATNEEARACALARKWMNENYNTKYSY